MSNNIVINSPNLRNVTLNLTSNWALYKMMSVIFHLNNAKKPLPVASPCCIRANPKGKPPIKTLQMKTFATSGKTVNYVLRFVIIHKQSMYFPFLFSLKLITN